MRADRVWQWVLGLTAAMLVFNLIYLAVVPLTLFPDEAYYWDWSRHPAWSYVSKGPVVATIIGMSCRLFGTSALAIRIPAAVLSALTCLVLARIAMQRRPVAGLWLTGVVLLAPLFNLGALVLTTDPPFALCWALALWGLWQAMVLAESERTPDLWLLLAAAAAGVGFLTKPSMALLALPLAVVVVRRRQVGYWLKRPGTQLGGVIGLFIVAPMLIWNARHGWSTLEHVAWQAGVGTGWSWSLPELLASQLGLLTPWLFGFVIWACVRAVRRPVHAGEELLAWGCLLLLGFFTIKSLLGDVETNWPLPAYLCGVVVAAGRWADDVELRRWWRKWLPATVALAVGTSFFFRALPFTYALVDSKVLSSLDPSRRAQGFDRLAAEVDAERRALAAENGLQERDVPVVGLTYQTAAVLAFYLPDQPATTVLPFPGRRRTSYDFWPDPAESGRPALLVARRQVEGLEPPHSLVVGDWKLRRVLELRVGRRRVDHYGFYEVRQVDWRERP